MYKKRVIVLALVLALLLSVASCGKDKDKKNKETGNEQNTQEESGGLTPESTHIVGWLWSNDSEDVYVNEFCIENPDFTIDNSEPTEGPFGEPEKDLQKLAGAIASGNQPDLFTGYMTPIEAFYTDMFMPIQQFLDIDPDLKIEDIDSQVFETTTFNNLIYFMPFDYTSQIFIWNKELFEKVGLDRDTPPKTWDEFLDYAKRLVTYKTDGSIETIGFYQDHFQWDTWHIITTGEHFVDKTGLNINIDTPSYLELMELTRKIADAHGGNDKLGTGGLGWWFLFGNVAMAQWSGSGLGWLFQNVNFEIGVSRTPLKEENGEYHSAVVVDSFLGIPRNARNPRGAWKLLKFVITDGRVPVEIKKYETNPNNYMSDYVIHKPTRQAVYEAIEPIIGEEKMAVIKARDQLIEECDRAYYKAAYHNEFMNYFNEKYADMKNHKLAPKDLLKQAQDYANTLRDEFIENKKAEGWIFDEEGNGIPPSMQKN